MIKDLDLTGKYSWQSALEMLLALCDRRADISFEHRVIGAWKIPSLELRLDAPQLLHLPEQRQQGQASLECWDKGTVVLGQPDGQLPEGEVWLLRENGPGAVIYRAFKQTVQTLEQLKLPVELAWSSIPLAPFCDDFAVTLEKEAACWTLGAIHTFWLRCSDDETVKAAAREMGACGQLRLQNMATANTWISGALEEQQLLQKLQGGQDR